jgi:cytochrome c biogenesis protein ResB
MKKAIAILLITALAACGGTTVTAPLGIIKDTVKQHDTTYYKTINAERKAELSK